MQASGARYALSVGFGRRRTGRLVTVGVFTVVLFVAGCCLGNLLSLMATNLGARSQADNTALHMLVGLAFAVLLGAFGAWMFAYIARFAAWLEGTRLTVRRIRTHSIDLRTATSMHLAAVTEPGPAVAGSTGAAIRTPVLTVSGPDGSVKLPLRGRDGALLPPPEMIVLADALSTAMCPGAREAAAWLRAMAADPRTLLM